jgi:hypothetical protein
MAWHCGNASSESLATATEANQKLEVAAAKVANRRNNAAL